MAIAATRGQPRVVDPIDTRSRRPATTIVLPTTPSHETSRSNEGVVGTPNAATKLAARRSVATPPPVSPRRIIAFRLFMQR
jgi:hypothetical protein